jgi:methyl-accepting chemotaxis protein
MSLQWFRNRTVMSKLLLGFAAVSAVMLGIGLMGIRATGNVQGNFQDAHENQLVPLTHLAAVRGAMLRVRINVLQHLVTQDTGKMREFEGQIRDLDLQVDKELAALEKARLTTEEKTAVAAFKQAWGQFKEARSGQTLPLSAAGKKAEAMAVALGQVGQRFREASDAVDRLFTAKVKAAEAAVAQGKEDYTATTRLTLLLLLVGLALSVALGYGIARIVARPLGQAVTVLAAVADGDFTKRLDVQSRDEVGQMATSLNQAVGSVRQALLEVAAGADQLATASQQLSAASGQLSSGAQEQASSLEETAASLEEITGTVKQNADNARQANQLAVGSRDAAEKGGQVVTSAVSAMGEINHASKKIADIITAIDEIAFQTNLLALNAAVEAARAGEQGRGFAVVAAEVRNLAQRSATAAKEIKGLIQDSVQKVEAGSRLVDQSGQTLQDIVTAVKRVTDIIAEIAAASQEQSQGIDQVNKAVTQMDQVTQANAAQTEELSSTAQALSTQAQQLQRLVARFRLGETAPGATAPAPGPAGVRRPASPARPAAPPRPARRPDHAPEPALAAAGPHNGHGAHDEFEEF